MRCNNTKDIENVFVPEKCSLHGYGCTTNRNSHNAYLYLNCTSNWFTFEGRVTLILINLHHGCCGVSVVSIPVIVCIFSFRAFSYYGI